MTEKPLSKGHVGLIGAGAMGSALIERLVANGFTVSVFDPVLEARERASLNGATCLQNAQAMFIMSIPVIICVASENAFTSTIDAAIAARAQNAAVVPGPVIEMSTLCHGLKEEGRVRLAAIGIVMLDCPVSGTSAQARNGDLAVFTSGDPVAVAICQPIFTAIAQRVVQAGDFGMGMTLKLLANHLVGLHSAVAGEVLMLARKSGLAVEVALEVLTASAGSSRMLEVRGPLMVNHDYLPATGSIDIIVKDGEMIKDLAHQAGCVLPLFDRAHSLYHSAQADGFGGADIASIHNYLLKNFTTET